MSQQTQFAAPLTPPNISDADDDEDARNEAIQQQQAEDFLASQEAAEASAAVKRKKVPLVPATPVKKPRKNAPKRHERNGDSQQASQALFPEDEEWETKAVQVGILSQDPATFGPVAPAQTEFPRDLSQMKFLLRHGDIKVRLHEETRDHVFEFLNDSLGKPILLFRQAMANLLNKVLPEAYEAYDAMLRDAEEYDEGTLFCKTVSKNDCFKIVVEISYFQNSLYIFFKRMSKPEAIRKLPQFQATKRPPYTGPTITPDAEGFVPSKGCCVQLDRDVDNPKTIMTWARECIAIPR
jgi:hypothetical protein